jgi:TolB protein
VSIIDVDGTNAMQVTSNRSVDVQPQWFADGRRLAFKSERPNAEGLWSVDLTTRREELMFDFARFDRTNVGDRAQLREFALNPSMAKAVFSVVVPPSANRQLHLISLPSLESRPLTDGVEWIGYPTWSPDERRLAVEIKDASGTHAGVVDLAGGKVRRLTNERGQTWIRSWSPDGTKIAAAAFRKGRWDLRWLDAATGRHGIITPPAPPRVYMRYPEWSPRGDVVVFERGELRGNVWPLPLKADAR